MFCLLKDPLVSWITILNQLSETLNCKIFNLIPQRKLFYMTIFCLAIAYTGVID